METLKCTLHMRTFVEDGCNSKHWQKKYVHRRSTTSRQSYPMWCHVTTVPSSIEIEDSRARRASPDWISAFMRAFASRLEIGVTFARHHPAAATEDAAPDVGRQNKAMEASTQRVNDKKRRGTSTGRSATGPSWLLRKLKLQWHVKTVTMRAGSLTTTDVDFFKTLLNRHEEAQSRMNALTAQLMFACLCQGNHPEDSPGNVRCF